MYLFFGIYIHVYINDNNYTPTHLNWRNILSLSRLNNLNYRRVIGYRTFVV